MLDISVAQHSFPPLIQAVGSKHQGGMGFVGCCHIYFHFLEWFGLIHDMSEADVTADPSHTFHVAFTTFPHPYLFLLLPYNNTPYSLYPLTNCLLPPLYHPTIHPPILQYCGSVQHNLVVKLVPCHSVYQCEGKVGKCDGLQTLAFFAVPDEDLDENSADK